MIEQGIAELLSRGIPADRLINQAPKTTLPPTGNTGTGYTPGDTSVATGKIADDAVTFAKMQNLTTDRLVGRDTTGTGDPEQLTVSGGLEFTGSGGIQRSALTGDVTASAGSGSTTIASDAVTYAKIQNVSAASKLLGRGDSGSGDPQEITLGTGLSMSGTTLSSSGGGSSDLVKIAAIDVSSAQATIDFTSIPNTYRALKIILQGRLTAAVADAFILVQLNADTGSNYVDQYQYTVGGGVNAAANSGTSGHIALMAGSTAPANSAGMVVIDIPFYAGTTFHKTLRATAADYYASNTLLIADFAVRWLSTNAINQVTFLLAAGNFDTGAQATLYGLA